MFKCANSKENCFDFLKITITENAKTCYFPYVTINMATNGQK